MTTACVIGWPIAHSRSPLIHNYWLREDDIAGAYDKRAVPPDELPRIIDEIRSGALAGCNVTVPHKEAALDLVDEADETARAVGAVNTIWREGGRVHGQNTDVGGFLANLDERAPGWDAAPLSAVVLGAGGAARAVLYALRLRKAADVRIVNRTLERAEDLAQEFATPDTPMRATPWRDLSRALDEATLLVNATSLGMAGSETLPMPEHLMMSAGAVVADLVYVPLETPLLRAAAQSGLRTADGLGMLLHQAVPGFEKWFGVRPKVTDELRRLVEADIARSPA